MMRVVLTLVLALGLSVETMSEARGEIPIYGEMPTVRISGVQHYLPPTRPTEAAILESIGQQSTSSRVLRVDATEHRVGEDCFYPLIGKARLSSARFRCEVEVDGKTRVVSVSQDVLVLSR